MNSVAQKLLQVKFSAPYNSIFFLCIMLSMPYLWDTFLRQEGPTDQSIFKAVTKVLDTEMENNIFDKENSKKDADSV